MKKRKNTPPYIMLAPSVVLMCGLVFYPILVTFTYSLQQMKLTEPQNDKIVGFKNYQMILADSNFWYSFLNSIIILVGVVILTVVIGIAFAMLLNVNTKIKGVLTAAAIIPWALPPIVNGVMWRWIFHPSYGFLNRLLLRCELIEEPVQWLSNRFSVILIVALVVAWRNIPFCAIVLLSALQGIPSHIYESAAIDGSSTGQMFRKITLPLLMPSLGIVVTSTSINAINVFDEIVSLSGYGDVSKTLMMDAYLRTFNFLDYGAGSAITYIIMIFAGILGLLYIRNLYREVNYL
ncbi:sugar ABC transporter permease [Lachnospiraceae bacterium 42-17]|jgi:multiple sugar transport system permease protein|nr:sugar ABC transporter permease [Dorea sp.]